MDVEHLQNDLRSIAAQILFLEDIDADSNLFDLGFDSITAIEFAVTVRNRYKIQAPVDVFFKHPTISGLAEQLAKMRDGAA